MSQRAVSQGLKEFNNISVFFYEISAENLLFFKKSKSEYLISLYTYDSIRYIFIHILLALCISHLKGQDTFYLRFFYICLHGCSKVCAHCLNKKKIQKKVQHTPLKQLSEFLQHVSCQEKRFLQKTQTLFQRHPQHPVAFLNSTSSTPEEHS